MFVLAFVRVYVCVCVCLAVGMHLSAFVYVCLCLPVFMCGLVFVSIYTFFSEGSSCNFAYEAFLCKISKVAPNYFFQPKFKT